MTPKTFITVAIAICAIGLCGCNPSNRKQAKMNEAMNAYVAPDLSDEEYYALIELSNLRDTSYMGATLPCAAICYSIENKYTGQRTIHHADVIFNSSISEVINATETDSKY
jgi:lipoprotein